MKLPEHIGLRIEHNPHRLDYEAIERWMEACERDSTADITAEDRAEILLTGEVWVIRWYPHTPVGWCAVAAATLERALELANQ